MYYFIVNYTGGSGKAQKTWNKVHYLLKTKNIEYKAYVTKKQGHAREIARKLSELDEQDIRIVVVGGDGTINEVINGITDFSRIRFGIIPTGSGNDFARGMNIPIDTSKALDKLLSSVRGEDIDLGEVTKENGEKRIFAISSGIGMDAIVCKKMIDSKVKKTLNKFGIGGFAYIVHTIATLFTMENYKVKVQMKDSQTTGLNEISFKDLIFLAAMNFSAEGGGVPMNPGAKCDDGLLSICAVSGIPKWKAFFMLPVLVKGRHKGKKGFLLEDVEELIFEAEKPMVLHADGEFIGEEKYIKMRVLRNVLNVMV